MKPVHLVSALVLGLATASAAAAADPVMGEWTTQSGTAKVRIAPCSGNKALMCGNIFWMKMPNDKAGSPQKDTNNPDTALQGRPILGLQILQNFKSAGPAKWAGGKIYDPESGKLYASKVGLNTNGTLKVEGCVSVICQAQTWRK